MKKNDTIDTGDIVGAGGSGGGSSTPHRTPDNIRMQDWMECVLGLGYGPIKGLAPGKNNKLENFIVGDTPLFNVGTNQANFPNFRIKIYAGLDTDPAINFTLGGASSNQTVNVQLLYNTPVVRTTSILQRGHIDRLEVRLVFQRLVEVTSKSATYDGTAQFRIEYKPSNSSVWSLFGGESVSTMTGKTSANAPKDFIIPVPRLMDDDWDVRVTKLTPENDTEVGTFADMVFESIQTVETAPKKYDDIAVVHLIGRATNQFASVPDFYGIYDGLIVDVPSNYDPIAKTYNESTPWNGLWKRAWTDNPAFLLRELIKNPLFGMAAYYLHVSVVDTEFYNAGKWCDDRVPVGNTGRTRPRFTMNMVVTEAMQGMEFLRYIAGAFNSTIFDDGNGNISLRTDAPRTPSYIFTPENISEEGFSYSYTDIATRYNDITVVFGNKDLDHNEDRRKATIDNTEAVARNGLVPYEFVAVGCDNVDEAVARANYRYMIANTEIATVSFTATRLGMLLDVFDSIYVADPRSGWSTGGRVKSVANGILHLRDPIYFATQAQVTLRIQTYEGLKVVQAIPTVMGVNYSLQLANPGALPDGSFPDRTTFTVEDTTDHGLAKPFRVVSIEESEIGLNAYDITAIEINVNKYHDADLGVESEPVDYSYRQPGEPILPPELILETGTAHILTGNDGTLINRIYASWEQPLNAYTAYYELDYKLMGDSTWTTVKALQNDAYLGPVQDDLLYHIRLFAVTPTGRRGREYLERINFRVSGKSLGLDVPTNVTVEMGQTGWVFGWDQPDAGDYDGMEIRQGGVNSNWDTARVIARRVKDNRFQYQWLGEGVTRFFFKYRDTSGNESNQPVVQDVEVYAPPSPIVKAETRNGLLNMLWAAVQGTQPTDMYEFRWGTADTPPSDATPAGQVSGTSYTLPLNDPTIRRGHLRAVDVGGNVSPWVTFEVGMEDTVDPTPPPTVTGLEAHAAINSITIVTDVPTYKVGHGHRNTRLYAVEITAANPDPQFNENLFVGTFLGSVETFPATIGTRWRFWAKWTTNDGYDSVSPSAPAEAETGKIGDNQLADDLDLASKLADGSITGDKLAAGAIDDTKFASGIEPVTIVPGTEVPTEKSTSTIVVDGQTYVWDATTGKYIKPGAGTVSAEDIEGLINSMQIEDGSITSQKLAPGAVDSTKFAEGVEPVTIVNDPTLPTTKSTSTILWQGKLYTWDGTKYSLIDAGSVKAEDIEGLIEAGQLKDGSVTTDKIAAGAVDATKFANGLEPIRIIPSTSPLPTTKNGETISWKGDLYRWNGTAYVKNVGAGDIVGQITATQISDNAITTPKLAAGSVIADKIATNAVTADKITANAIQTSHISAGAVKADQISAGAITASKMAITGVGDLLSVDPYFEDPVIWENPATTAANGSKPTVVTSADAYNGAKMLETDGYTSVTYGERWPIDPKRQYLIESVVKRPAATTGSFYAIWKFYTATGEGILAVTGLGWPGTNSYNHYAPSAQIPPADVWTRYTFVIGEGANIKIPPNAAYMSIGFITGYNTGTGKYQIGRQTIAQMKAGELIVDGAITAEKIVAGAITTDKIAANSIVASKLTLTDSSNLFPDYDALDSTMYTPNYVADNFLSFPYASGPFFGKRVVAIAGSETRNYTVRVYNDIGGFQVEPNTEYLLTAMMPGTGESTVRLYTREASLDASGNPVWGADVQRLYRTVPMGIGTEPQSIAFTTGPNTKRMSLLLRRDMVGTTPALFGGITLRRKNGAELIVDGAITAGKIAANAITADNIQANAVTVGKVAAGAINTRELAAGAITASKIKVSAMGDALNPDSLFTDQAIWSDATGYGATQGSRLPVVSTIPDGYSGGAVLTCTGYTWPLYDNQKFPIDPGKQYLIEIAARFVSGTARPFYGCWRFYDANGVYIRADDVMGWPSRNSSVGYYAPSGAATNANWQRWSYAIGKDAVMGIPPNARFMSAQFIANYNTTDTTTVTEVGLLRVSEMVAGELIVDGAITADKIRAGSISAAKLMVGDFSNIVPDSGLLDKTAWMGAQENITFMQASSFETANRVARWQNTTGYTGTANAFFNDYRTQDIPVEPGAEYFFSVDFRSFTTGTEGTVMLHIVEKDAAGAEIQSGTVSTPFTLGQSTAEATKSGRRKLNAKTVRVAFRIRQTYSAAGAFKGTWYFYNPIMRRATSNVMIEDGAISSEKVQAKSITASKLTLGDFSNLAPDASMIDPDAWTMFGTWAWSAGAPTVFGTVNMLRHGYVAGNTGWGGTARTSSFSVEPNRDYFFEFRCAGGAAGGYSIRCNVVWQAANGTDISSVVLADVTESGTTVQARGGQLKAPNNAVQCQLRFSVSQSVTTVDVRLGGIVVRRAASAELIVDGAVTADKVAANAITAGKIAAGAVNAREIAAGSITASKLVLTDGTNLFPDYDMVDTDAYTGTGGTFSFELASLEGTGRYNLVNAARTTNVVTRAYADVGLAVEPNTEYYLQVTMQCTDSVARIYTNEMTQDASGNLVRGSDIVRISRAANAASGVGSTTFTTGANTKRLQIVFRRDANGSAPAYYGGLMLRRRNGAELIVDGAIVANKLAANAIAVGTAAVQDAAITNAMIANLSADKINTGYLNAARIQAGTINAGHLAANSIYSDKIVAGAVDAGKIAARSITADRIQGGAITADELVANNAFIRDGTLQGAKIGIAQIWTGHIADAQISTAKIGVAQIDTLRIAGGAVVAGSTQAWWMDIGASSGSGITDFGHGVSTGSGGGYAVYFCTVICTEPGSHGNNHRVRITTSADGEIYNKLGYSSEMNSDMWREFLSPNMTWAGGYIAPGSWISMTLSMPRPSSGKIQGWVRIAIFTFQR